MKKTLIPMILLVVLQIEVVAQEKWKELNTIILIDNDLVVGNITNLRIIPYSNTEKVIKLDYMPGKLAMNQSDFEDLMNSEVNTIVLKFDHVEFLKEIKRKYNYEIELKKNYLLSSYFVIRIYNTNKRKFRRLYCPLVGKKYTFELESPNFSMKRIKKR